MISSLLILATLVHWAVDPMSETPYLPDAIPADGRQGGDVQVIAAKGEYEPGSFVLRSDSDLGKVELEVGDLRTKDGKVFPRGKLDLKTVKVWYQSGNAWFTYFADKGTKLCPELLLNDEDLIRVDTAKRSNFARLTEKDGRVHEFWLNNPQAFQDRAEDVGHGRLGDTFRSMRENFRDAPKHAGATLPKGVSKQFFLTANVTKDTTAGLYRGEVKIKSKAKGEQWSVPIVLRVLPFELPRPMCYFDVNKPFLNWFCDYTSLSAIRMQNGDDPALARRQLEAICRDFAAHGQYLPSFRGAIDEPEIVKAAGQDYTADIYAGNMKLDNMCEMRADARKQRRLADARFGKGSEPLMSWGDEYGLALLKSVRPMVRVYHENGIRFAVNSRATYTAGIELADLFWPPGWPDRSNAEYTAKFNEATAGVGYFGWYAGQHVGVENPAFCRRQYGFGPYRAGFSCNYNYAHHLDEWNDGVADYYRPMAFVYGCGDGCLDTIAWEGFREGQDDIRYATLLKRLALPLAEGRDVDARAAARKALKLLADADRDDMDLTTLRREMIVRILGLLEFTRK